MKKWHYEIGSIIALLICEIVFWKFSEPLTGLPFIQPTADAAVPAAKRTFINKSCNGRILLFGDSSCMFGLKPSVIEDILKTPCSNLGTISTLTISGVESQVRDVLSKYTPKAIVLVLIPRSFEVDHQKAKDFKMVGSYLLAYNSESNIYKPAFADFKTLFFQKHQFNIFPAEFGGSYKNFLNILHKNDGYFPEFHTYTNNEGFKTKFNGTSFAESGLKAIDSITSKHNVPVYLWISPSPADAVDSGFIRSVNEYSHNVVSVSRNLKLLQDAQVWGTNLFSTVTHVNDSGATLNSIQLASALKSVTAVTTVSSIAPDYVNSGY